jgi:hypothetical protein
MIELLNEIEFVAGETEDTSHKTNPTVMFTLRTPFPKREIFCERKGIMKGLG